MAYGNGTFVGVGGGLRFLSHDGSAWAVYANPPVLNSANVSFGNGNFVMFGTATSGEKLIYKSTNGINWNPIYTNLNAISSASYGNGSWVFIGASECLIASTASPSWSWTEFQPAFTPFCITFANGAFILSTLISSKGYIFSSTDGITWQLIGNQPNTFTKIIYGNGVYVANGGTYIYTTTDFLTWATNNATGVFFNPITLSYGAGQFIICGRTVVGGSTNGLYSSPDGYSWTRATTNFYTTNSITFGQGIFVSSIGNTIYQSGTISAPTNYAAANLFISTYPGISITGTPGLTYQIQYSTILNSNWLTLTNFSLPYSPYLWIDTSSPVSGQRFYRSAQLQ